jgi:hypothetical protein
MLERPTYGWFARILIVRFLILQGVLLALFGLDLSQPSLLLLYAGLLVGAYVCWVGIAKPPRTRLGAAGCLMVTAMLLLSGVLGSASWLAYVAGFPSTRLAEHASALFTVVILLGPITYHWLILEECHYQVYLAPMIERDLGFEAATNTLEGGCKYLFLSHLQSGGVMDQAGFRPYDIVVDGGTFTEFWQRLEEARGGSPVPITVASWFDSGPVSERPTRQCSVSVPQQGYISALEEELGFRCAVKYVKENGAWTGVVLVTKVCLGGAVERAGFHDGDILLDVGGVPHLFEKLEQARGHGPVTLEVVPWLDPTDIAERPVRELALAVPPAVDDRTAHRWAAFRSVEDLQRDLGFRQGWERLPHRGEWHGWPIVEDLLPDGVLARAGFQTKDILLEGFSWRTRWQKARGKEPITVKVAHWMEPQRIRERIRRQLAISVPGRHPPRTDDHTR